MNQCDIMANHVSYISYECNLVISWDRSATDHMDALHVVNVQTFTHWSKIEDLYCAVFYYDLYGSELVNVSSYSIEAEQSTYFYVLQHIFEPCDG